MNQVAASRSIPHLLWAGSYVLLLTCSWLFGTGCASPAQTVGLTAGIVAGTTLVGARSPGHEMQQVYYLGTIDPLEQLPPTIYRLTVRGQSSGMSSVRFTSGWAPAELIDTLNSAARFTENGSAPLAFAGTNQVNIAGRRRFVMFGPDGFRAAPKDYRLVIVMGANPDRFFQAIDEVLGSLGQVTVAKEGDQVKGQLLQAYSEAFQQSTSLRTLGEDLRALTGK